MYRWIRDISAREFVGCMAYTLAEDILPAATALKRLITCI